MATFLTDVHTHSAFSPDGASPLSEMVQEALEKGIAFFGVSEHIDYDLQVGKYAAESYGGTGRYTDADAYFHAARHLQDDSAGVINFLVGAEFGYSDDERVVKMYQDFIKKYSPDFVINSISLFKIKILHNFMKGSAALCSN